MKYLIQSKIDSLLNSRKLIDNELQEHIKKFTSYATHYKEIEKRNDMKMKIYAIDNKVEILQEILQEI